MLTPRSYVLERGVEDTVGFFGKSMDEGRSSVGVSERRPGGIPLSVLIPFMNSNLDLFTQAAFHRLVARNSEGYFGETITSESGARTHAVAGPA